MTNTGATLHEVASTLQGVAWIKRGESFKAKCPCHNDNHASLVVSRGTTQDVVAKCHAGCDQRDVINALGILAQDNTSKPIRQPTKPKLSQSKHMKPRTASQNGSGDTIYDYVYEDGSAAFQVVRKHPKGFYQRKKEGERWTYKLGATRRVLYRLPAVLKAIEEGKTIFVVEGEKDVHTLESWGLVATTGAGGAGKWLPSYSVTLSGADVVILPDNDDAGKAHAEYVKEALRGLARSVRIVSLPVPPKGDVTDYAADHTKLEFIELLADKHRTFTVHPLWGYKEPEPLEWYIDHFLPKGHVTNLVAGGGTGKSYLAMYLSVCVSLGKPFLGLATTKGKVMYVDMEGLGPEEHSRRHLRIMRGMGLDQHHDSIEKRFYYVEARASLGDDGFLEELALFSQEQGIDLIVIDSITMGMGTSVDMIDAGAVAKLFRRLQSLGTVVAIDHTSKASSQGSSRAATAIGSVMKYNSVRSAWNLRRLDSGSIHMTNAKMNFDEKQDDIIYRLNIDAQTATFSKSAVEEEDIWIILPDANAANAIAIAMTYLCGKGQTYVNKEDLQAWLKFYGKMIAIPTISRHLNVLMKRGIVMQKGNSYTTT